MLNLLTCETIRRSYIVNMTISESIVSTGVIGINVSGNDESHDLLVRLLSTEIKLSLIHI